MMAMAGRTSAAAAAARTTRSVVAVAVWRRNEATVAEAATAAAATAKPKPKPKQQQQQQRSTSIKSVASEREKLRFVLPMEFSSSRDGQGRLLHSKITVDLEDLRRQFKLNDKAMRVLIQAAGPRVKMAPRKWDEFRVVSSRPVLPEEQLAVRLALEQTVGVVRNIRLPASGSNNFRVAFLKEQPTLQGQRLRVTVQPLEAYGPLGADSGEEPDVLDVPSDVDRELREAADARAAASSRFEREEEVGEDGEVGEEEESNEAKGDDGAQAEETQVPGDGDEKVEGEDDGENEDEDEDPLTLELIPARYEVERPDTRPIGVRVRGATKDTRFQVDAPKPVSVEPASGFNESGPVPSNPQSVYGLVALYASQADARVADGAARECGVSPLGQPVVPAFENVDARELEQIARRVVGVDVGEDDEDGEVAAAPLTSTTTRVKFASKHAAAAFAAALEAGDIPELKDKKAVWWLGFPADVTRERLGLIKVMQRYVEKVSETEYVLTFTTEALAAYALEQIQARAGAGVSAELDRGPRDAKDKYRGSTIALAVRHRKSAREPIVEDPEELLVQSRGEVYNLLEKLVRTSRRVAVDMALGKAPQVPPKPQSVHELLQRFGLSDLVDDENAGLPPKEIAGMRGQRKKKEYGAAPAAAAAAGAGAGGGGGKGGKKA